MAGCLDPKRKQLEEVINNSNTCDAMEERPSSHTYPVSSSVHPLSSNPFPIFPPHTHEITSRCKHLFCPKCNNNTDTTKIAIKDELGERKAKEKKAEKRTGSFESINSIVSYYGGLCQTVFLSTAQGMEWTVSSPSSIFLFKVVNLPPTDGARADLRKLRRTAV